MHDCENCGQHTRDCQCDTPCPKCGPECDCGPGDELRRALKRVAALESLLESAMSGRPGGFSAWGRSGGSPVDEVDE